MFEFLRNWGLCCAGRYVALGNGILQPYQIINELEKVIEEDEKMKKLQDSPFSKVLQSAQVTQFRLMRMLSSIERFTVYYFFMILDSEVSMLFKCTWFFAKKMTLIFRTFFPKKVVIDLQSAWLVSCNLVDLKF
jgi:hypothetical protein